MTPTASALLRRLDRRIALFLTLHDRAQAAGDTIAVAAYRGWLDATRAARADVELAVGGIEDEAAAGDMAAVA